ncbi:NAD(P)-binding protein [Aureobasidium sp. EXF-8845]|nr:NAD(P)-binding protein [Aureobasidium sp. EXF-8845]KAI4844478.1 NAD(P)-binding protein [Aureobasidium sp. EXF-8846]
MPSFLKKVAIVGATGNMGRHILDQLFAKNNHSITALTRMNSNISLDPSITIHEVDYNDISNLTTSLRDHDILIITLSVTAPSSVHSNLVQAAAAAGIKYIIPNAYGFNFRNPALLDDIPAASKTASYLFEIESLGMTHFSLVCSFWYEWSLGVGMLYGIDIASKTAVFFDDGNTKINTSTWKLSGDAVAGIVALPVEELEAKWKNKSFFVSSFRVSQREMLDSVHRVLGTSDKDWTIEYQSTKQRYEDGNRDMQKGDFTGFARAMYARVFYPDGSGDFETSHGLDNRTLDLPSEDLDAATRKTIELVNSGWNPFA